MSKTIPGTKEYEFHRGYEGGYRDGIREAFQLLTKGGQVAEVVGDFEKDMVTFKVPKENIRRLIDETEKEMLYP